MTWSTFHRRGEILRAVIDAAGVRQDGALPMDVDGVAEAFGDELTLLGALQMRWNTRLAGRIERELMGQPTDLEQAVVTAWQETAGELPGILAIVDRQQAEPRDVAMAEALRKSTLKGRTLMAVAAGRASAQDAAAARVGAEIEARARATYRLAPTGSERANQGLLERIKAALAA